MKTKPNQTKTRGIAWCMVAYSCAILAAWTVIFFFDELSALESALWGDLAGTLVIFAFSFALNNSSIYDAYWSVAPPLVVLHWIIAAPVENAPLRSYLILGLMALWSIRLTYNWVRHWQGLSHEDWRYVQLREKTKNGYWWVSFFGLHLFPTAIVFVACLPIYLAINHPASQMNWLDVLAAITVLAAIAIEAKADQQLHQFIATASKPGETMQYGLWAYSRHPNYFGQLLLWCGFFVFGIAANLENLWSVIGAIAIYLMLWFVSIPMMEERNLRRRAGYEKYMLETSTLIPFSRKKSN